jgi:hypothetical protein
MPFRPYLRFSFLCGFLKFSRGGGALLFRGKKGRIAGVPFGLVSRHAPGVERLPRKRQPWAIGYNFLEPDGSLSRDIFFDGAHHTDKGYVIWRRVLRDAGVVGHIPAYVTMK